MISRTELPAILGKHDLSRHFKLSRTQELRTRKIITDKMLDALGLTVKEYNKIKQFDFLQSKKLYELLQITKLNR